MKTNVEFKKWLNRYDACSPAMEWLGNRTPEQTFKECHRADWLLFWISRAVRSNLPGYPSLDQLKKCAIEIARKVKHLCKDERINEVFTLLDEYLKTGDKEIARKARELAWKVRHAAAAYADADAAADAAAYAAAYADAAAYAAAYADAAAYAAAARDKMRLECADLVRELLPINFSA